MNKDYSFKKNKTGYMLIAPAMLAVLLLAIYPMVYGVFFSFFEYDLMNVHRSFIGLQNYIKVVKSGVFQQALGNTLVWTFFNVSFQLVIAMVVALALNEKMACRNFFRTSIMVPWAIPSVIAVLTFRFLYDSKLGVTNLLLQALGIIDKPVSWLGNIGTAMPAIILESIWKGMPFVLIFILAALQTIPHDIYESCQLDGANGIQRFFRITLPMVKETVGIAAILTTIGTINNFNTVWLLTKGGPLNRTEILFTLAYRKGFVEYNFGTASAVSVIIFLIIMVLTKLYTSVSDRKGD